MLFFDKDHITPHLIPLAFPYPSQCHPYKLLTPFFFSFFLISQKANDCCLYVHECELIDQNIQKFTTLHTNKEAYFSLPL